MDAVLSRSWLALVAVVALFLLAVGPPTAAAAGPSAPAPTPPPAHIGEEVCVSSAVTGAEGRACARRDRFGVAWVLSLEDTRDDERPVTATISLEVADARDPDATLRIGGGDATIERSSGSFQPLIGSAIGELAITTCVSIRFFPDRCETNAVAVPQLVGRASPAQAARLEELVFERSLEDFVAISRRERRVGVDADFDWQSDGCSAGPFSDFFTGRLEWACLRHDFAYRNYGQRFLDPTDSVRRRVDEQLAADAESLGQAGLARGLFRGLQRFAAPVFFGDDLATEWRVPAFLVDLSSLDPTEPID